MTNPGVLYIVPTPIGNLDDITLRALQVLKSVDLIAAEDTRHSQKLLHHFGVDKPLTTYHDHGAELQGEKLLQRLSQGESIALISDAGTPLISDPGYRLVRQAREQGIAVTALPGASATLTALSASGLATDRFTFAGFLPAKSQARKAAYESLVNADYTSVYFESPHRIEASIADAVEVLGGERQAVLARELTKTFETWLGPDLESIQRALGEDSNQRRGEMVLMIGGVEHAEKAVSLDSEAEKVMSVLAQELPTKQAARLGEKITGVAKKVLYQWAVSVQPDDRSDA